MREILFRGKLKNTGEWAFGNLNITIKGTNIITPDDTPIGKYGAVIPETVGQYTGLTDKNGTKIFEGDIVEFERHGYLPFVEQGAVVFKNGCYGIEYEYFSQMFHRIGEVEEWKDMGGIGTITYTYEVIGNIHDNPELLKGGASDA